jgi:hypothetical protein
MTDQQPEAPASEPRKCRAAKRGVVDLLCVLAEDHACRGHEPGSCPEGCTGGWHQAIYTEHREASYDGSHHAISIVETVIWEPAPEPLTATQLDRLRQMTGEDAIAAVGRGLDLAVKLGGAYPEGRQIVAAARQALRVLGGEEAGAEPAASSTDAKEGPWTESPGVALIAVERSRQVTAKGYTPAHDARHDGSQLARAAACYALYAAGVRQLGIHPLGTAWPWPWPDADFRPGDDPVRALTKAGALIAAELDRLIAKGATHG